MKSNETRQIKIDLQIRRKRENVMSPVGERGKGQMPSTRSTNGRGINVTMHNKEQMKSNTQSITKGKDPKKIVVSEFQIGQMDQSNTNPNLKNPVLNKSIIEAQQNKENVPFNGQTSQIYSSHLRQQAKLKSIKQKRQLISLLQKKQAQIEFYQNLLKQKQEQHKAEEVQVLEQYEHVIESLINAYQKEVEKNEQLKKLKEEEQMEKEYQRRRELITLDGKMGLNYSPKQLSTFSGMSGGSILLQSLQERYSGGMRKQRSSLFSFGSSNKLSRSRSVNKQPQFKNFLNPGRAMFMRGKRIAFD